MKQIVYKGEWNEVEVGGTIFKKDVPKEVEDSIADALLQNAGEFKLADEGGEK